MTEKFNLRAGYYHNYTGICSDTDENLTTNEVVDLLNEQGKTIKELEREKKSYMNDAIKFEKECKRLYNNLRLTNSDLYYEKVVHDNCKKENGKLKQKIKELEKENENQNNILEDFMVMLNRLQAEPDNKSLQMMAKDMLRMMGKDIMGDVE